MAKVTFTKLGLKEDKHTVEVMLGNIPIEVKQYLPINDKLGIITDVINQARDENNFANPMKLNMFLALEVIFNYTNISFTDKQKEDLIKLYDILASNGVIKTIYNCIPAEELNTLSNGLYDSVGHIYSYYNSVRGIMEDLSKDYNNLSFDLNKINEEVRDPNTLKLLKDIAPYIAPTANDLG